MNKFRFMMQRYMKPEGTEGGTGGSGTVDRGDDFTPTAEDIAADEAARAATAAAATKDTAALEAERDQLGLGAGKTEAEKAAGALAATAAAAAAAAAGGDPDKDADKDGKKKDTRIPLARHQEILSRERAAREALEVQLQNAKKSQKLTETNEQIAALEAKVNTLEEQYNTALTNGDTKEATALMRQIREAERTITEQKADFRTQAATAIAVEQVRFETTIERLEQAYPQLKVGTETFDQALVAEIVELREAYELKGYQPSAALQKAVSIMIPASTKKQEDAVTVTPRVTEDDAAKAKAQREEEARKRNVATANAQPASLAQAGANSDEAGGKLDAKQVIKMPYDKFKNLSEEDLSRMRGDTL